MEIKWDLLKLQVGFANFSQIRKLVTVLVEFEVRPTQIVNIFIITLEKMCIHRTYRACWIVQDRKSVV